MKITLLKPYRKTEVANRVALEEVARMIAEGDAINEVHRIREIYHLMHPHRLDDGRVETSFAGGIKLPRVCFSAEFEHRNNEHCLLNYTGIVVVEVNNLATYDEAISIRDAAKRMPHTMMCFLGGSGRSVKIVCRGEQIQGQAAPVGEEEIARFHEQLYHMARKAYGAQLDVSIETLKPHLYRTVYLSVDPDLGWNEHAIPFYVNNGLEMRENVPNTPDNEALDHFLLPGRGIQRSYRLNYLFILESVLGTYFDLPDEERQAELVMRIATRCLKEGIPMGLAQSMTLEHPVLNTDELLVRKTFQSVYTVEHLKEYQEKHKFRPMKSIPEDALLMMKTEAFLNANYEMRKNVMTGVAQFRERDGRSFDFRDLDQEARNDMTIRAKELGLKSWDKDIDRFIDSTRIEKYDPVNDYLERLPRWDGKDRVTELAKRVPTNQPHWEMYLRIWLLGMVAHWMGRSSLTGNALVPLLIGRQGCGKSSLCRVLLPQELRDYYNDRITFRNEIDLNLGLTSFALINIDEFDKVTQRQQVLLKYLLSTADVKFRPPYGKTVKQYRRYASFIATTNEKKPLNDPTGSRRFVCVEVTGDIDFSDTINHMQLYAQLRQQVIDGERYWLNDEETQILNAENERFQRVNALEEMIAETFRKPASDGEGAWWTLGEVSEKLKSRYRQQDLRQLSFAALGRVMNYARFGFESKRRTQGMVYRLVERLLLFFCLLLPTTWAKAATFGEKSMINLTLTDGLAGETVRNIMTDHNGYVWIATTGGVSIYNGQQLMTLRIQRSEEEHTQKQARGYYRGHILEVFDLCETRDHTVYAATEGGLYRLATVSGEFEHILPEVERPLGLLAVGDTVYIAGEQGLLIYDGKHLKHKDIGASRKGLDNVVRHYVVDEKGALWFLGRHDLNCYDPKTGAFTNYNLLDALDGRQSLTQFAIYNDKFFIGTRSNGLYVYDMSTRKAHHVDGVGKIVMTVQKSSDGLIAVATDGTGACLLNPETEQVVEQFSMGLSGMNRLPTNALYCFYRDANGVNWFGTVRCGLVYTPYNSGLFLPYRPDGLPIVDMNVRSFLIRGSQSVIGLQNGLWFIDSERHLRRYFSAEELGGHIVNNVGWWQGAYYIGMFDGGVRKLDPQTATITHQTFSSLLAKTSVGDIKAAPDGSLWIGSSDGLFIISQDGTVRQMTEQNSHILGGIIIDITFDREGNGWLTGTKGLSLYSVASRDIVEADFPPGFFHHEPYMRGILGHDDLIYMRNGPQLFYTTTKMERFGELQLPVSLMDRWCRGMVDDRKGQLWLASERGLLGIDYDGHGLIQIGEGEGLIGSNLSEVRIDGDSMLWVATSEGLYYTSYPALKQRKDHINHRMTLYNIRVGSYLINPKEMSRVTEEKEIRLKWNLVSQVLQADPLLLDYARQQGRFYEYRVDDGDWILLDDNEPIVVRHLMMGNHQLTLRMAGVKSTETVYQVKVVPSFWAIFELVFILSMVLIQWLWWRYRSYTKQVISEHHLTEQALIEELEELTPLASSDCDTTDYSALDISLDAGEGSGKYQKVKIDEDECAQIVSRMKEYLERERVYTNADLKMKDLAAVLHLSAPKLSQVFNIYLKENYYEFINRYRLNEFKRLIEAGEYKRFTITALSEQCGFKRSNFFSTFRKVEGVTPVEYLRKQGIRV